MRILSDIVICRITTLKRGPLPTICTRNDLKLTRSLQFTKLFILPSSLIDQKLSHTTTWISDVTLPQPTTLTLGHSQFQRPKRKLRSGLSRINETLSASKIRVRPRPKLKRLRRRSRGRNRRSRRNMLVEARRALLRMSPAADTGRKRSRWSSWIMKSKNKSEKLKQKPSPMASYPRSLRLPKS